MQKVQKVQEDLFDVEECIAENEQLQHQKGQEERQLYYKSVDLPYFEDPKDDNQMMFNLQYQYLKEGNIKARQELFSLSYKVMKRILWNLMKKGGLGYLDEEAQIEIVDTAFIYVFRRYESGNGYTVKKSFISVLKGGIRHALDYTTMKDKELSLSDIKNITWKATGLYN